LGSLVSTKCRPRAFDLFSFATQKSRLSIANAATAAPMPISALAPVVSPLLDIDEVLDAMDLEGVNDDEADAVVFGFCSVTVRLARMKYP
jgi:hypothetical protein